MSNIPRLLFANLRFSSRRFGHPFLVNRSMGMLAFLAVFFSCGMPTDATGQTPRSDARDSIVGSVAEQAEMVRAQADSTRQRAHAFREFAKGIGDLSDSLEKSVDLDMKQFRGYWQKKRERLAVDRSLLEKRIENQRLVEVRRRGKIAFQWERMYRFPSAWRNATLNGNALNLMLDQIGVHTSLTYSPELSQGGGLPEENRFRLPSAVIDAIRVRVPSSRGGTASIKLTDPVPLDVSWWPTLLRDEDFKHERSDLTDMRSELAKLALANDDLSTRQLDEMEEKLAALTSAFFRKYPPSKRKGLETKRYQLIFQAEDFLRQLDLNLMQIAVTGTLSSFGGDPFRLERDGKDLATLYHYMLSNSLRFDAPRPADERHYLMLTNMTKEFCEVLAISPDKEWIESAQIDLDFSLGDDVPKAERFRGED